MCWPDPTRPAKIRQNRDPTRPDPTRGSIRPVDNSAWNTYVTYIMCIQVFFCESQRLWETNLILNTCSNESERVLYYAQNFVICLCRCKSNVYVQSCSHFTCKMCLLRMFTLLGIWHNLSTVSKQDCYRRTLIYEGERRMVCDGDLEENMTSFS